VSAPARDLGRDLRRLGLEAGDTVVVHVALSRVGPLDGGPAAFLDALREVVGDAGTIVMPAFTPALCHPAAIIRPSAPPPPRPATAVGSGGVPRFDAAATPVSPRLGVVAEAFRHVAGTRRSGHPHVSFCANGPEAGPIVEDHPLPFRLGPQSPLGRLAERAAKVLMVGSGWETCTSLHLAEYHAPYAGRLMGWWPVPGDGEWLLAQDLLLWEGDFGALGAGYEAARPAGCRSGAVGGAASVVVPFVDLVEFATTWLIAHRDLRGRGPAPGWLDVTLAGGHRV
jgi:aminoglycoside 3-N-acetyltransferase